MDIQSRKIEFVQEFLKLQSEEAISRLEKMLKKESKVVEIEPMTQEKLNKRIDQSESDFENNRYKSSSDLLAKFN